MAAKSKNHNSVIKNTLEIQFLRAKKILIKTLTGSKFIWTDTPEELVDFFMRKRFYEKEYLSMNDHEREILTYYSNELDNAKKQFIIALADIQNDNQVTKLIGVAHDLMNASYGLRGFLSEDWSIHEFQKKEFAKLNSERMRKKKADKSGPLVAKRREIIKKLYTKKLTGSETCANQIIEKCRDKFNEAGISSYSNRTIRGDVAAILKELP